MGAAFSLLIFKMTIMRYTVLIGRIFFSLMFINAITFHLTKQAVDYAAAYNVPAPQFFVPFSGVIAFLGGLSIALGFKAKIGAWLIVIFLVPVTFMMHAFWLETDPVQTQMQMSNFLKNISMLGGALLITYFGAGPLSIDHRLQMRVLTAEDALAKTLSKKGVQLEDTKDKIKVVAYSDAIEGLERQQFWQSADDPCEVVFVFRAKDLVLAKQCIKKTAYSVKQQNSENKEPEMKVREMVFLTESTI